MEDVGGFVRSMFVMPKEWASDEDLVDWHQGRIPKVYQSPSNPSLLKFEDLNDNLVVQSIRSAMRTRRLTSHALDKALNIQKRMKSSFSLKMEGVFSPSHLELEDHSGDMKFTCEIKPITGFAWEENTRLRMIDNFVGAYYIIHMRLDAFENDYSANIAKKSRQLPYLTSPNKRESIVHIGPNTTSRFLFIHLRVFYDWGPP